ncbi:MAG: GAF domain-containing protein [Bacteroidota bacterium]
MSSILTKVVNAGITEDQPKYLKRKIRLSNYVALLLAFGVALPFVFISMVYFPPNTYIPSLAVGVALLSIFFNNIGMHLLGRVVISILPVVLTALYGANLSMIGEEPVVGIYMIQLSFSIVPFLVFDLRDKGFLISLALIEIALLFAYDFLNNAFEVEMETEVIRSGYLSSVSVFLSCFFMFGGVLILVRENYVSELKSDELLSELNEEREKMKESEEELKQNLDKIKEKQIEEEKRKWASEGIAEISGILRIDDSFDVVCDNLVSYIVKYTRSTQGGIYLTNENDEGRAVIELKSMYAYDRKKFTEKEIYPGQGLIGQAFLEKEHIYITEIPQDYLSVTSGLGEANPTALIIIPLITNDEVEGFIELASFNEFEEHEVNFLKEMGEGVASTVRNSRINDKTKILLEQSQQQSEELQAQEEEMRQNMEELEATQEENRRKSMEMEGFIHTLNNAVATIEFSPEGKILKANENWCKTVGGTIEQIKGKHHQIFVDDAYAASDEYKSFWKKLASGEAVNGEFHRRTLRGDNIWLRASYTPIRGEDGQVHKVIKFAFDITDLKKEAIKA